MSRDVITVRSTMRILLLYRVSLAGNAQNAPPTLKDPKFWTAEEKKTRKIDRLARSLLIQGRPNDIYSLIDSNKTAKDLWDALERQMRGSEYAEQDKKTAILYEYKTFKATEGEQQTKNLIDINIDALYNILKQNQGDVNDALGYKKKDVMVTSDPLALVVEKTKVSKQKEKVVVSLDSGGSGADDISELKKITALLAKDFNRRNFYSKPTNNNLRTSSTSQSTNKKQEFVKSNDKKEDKKANDKKRDMRKVKCYNYKKEEHFPKDCKKAKVKDCNYYKTKMLLAKKDSDEQVLLAKDQAWMESSSDSDQEINANMVFMAQIEKVLSDSDESSSSAEETIAEVAYYISESESEYEFETIILILKNTDKSEDDHNDSEEKKHLVDKLIRKFNHKIAKYQKRSEKAKQQSKDFENQNKDLQDKYDVFKNQTTTFEVNNNELNERLKVLIEKNDDLLAQTEVLQDQLQVKHVVIDRYTSMFFTHSDEALEIQKFKRSRENKIKFAYDYGNLNQTSSLKPYVPNVILEKIIIDLEDEVVNILEKEKVNLETIESLKSKSVESSETVSFESKNQSDYHVVEKQCGNMKSSKLIAPGMFKLNVSQCVSPISMSKSSCDSNNDEIKLKRKRHCPDLSLDHRFGMFKAYDGPEEVILPQTNTQLILNNMIPNVDEASTSHNVFNERLEDAYFDAIGYSQQKGIDYDETFAPVARIEAIRLFLPYAAHKDFTVFQMDVKTAFLNEIFKEEVYVGQPPDFTAFLNEIFKEEVYVGQPPDFVSKQYLDHVYALDKALFEMENCDTVHTPMVKQAKLKLDLVGKPVDHIDYQSMIGSLMYVTSIRPDIMFATFICARYHANPNEHHVSVVKMIFHYLKGTINLGLWYPKDFGFDLTAYSDADYAGCHLDRKTESEYVAVSSCCAQVLWMRTQLTDYGFFYDKVPIYCDSKSAIAISCNPIQHTRTKHIDVRYHFIKDHVEKETIELYFVGSEYQLADLFTKSLHEARFKFLVEKLGMMSRET
nr:hypothetical protein [Tanacetum cinerariifolium]